MSAPVILLSAGKSSRFGEGPHKALFRQRPEDAPWLVLQLRRLARAGGRQAVLVLGFRAEEILAGISSLPRPGDSGELEGVALQVVLNPHPEFGPFSSLQAGLRALKPGMHAFVLPVDVPCPEPEVWCALENAGADSQACGKPWASVPLFEGRAGHPICLGNAFIEGLLTQDPGDPGSRLDHQLRSLAPGRLRRVEVLDPRVLANCNRPGEMASELGAGMCPH